jgi:lysosomal-trafficking regulator
MPKQIFTTLHKKSHQLMNNDNQKTFERCVLKNVKGLRWGIFTGSPHLPKPEKIHSFACNSKRIISLNDSNVYYGLAHKMHLMKSSNEKFHDLVIWSENDGIVRVKSLKDLNEKPRKLFHISNYDPITACGSHVKHSNLWFGHESGIISVFTRSDEVIPFVVKKKNLRAFNETLESIIGLKDEEQHDDEENISSRWNYPISLVKHKSPIIDIKICAEFDVVLSIAINGQTTIWDARKIEYIRTIEPSCNTLQSQLSIVDISPTLGDILTIFTPKTDNEISTVDDENLEVTDGDDFINVSMAIRGKSQLRLHTINAKYINHTFTNGFATAACFSFIKEGTGVNVIAVGFDDGMIRLFSSWTLDLVREIATGVTSPVNQITYTTNQHLVILANQEIHIWSSEGVGGEVPKFHQFKIDKNTTF